MDAQVSHRVGEIEPRPYAAPPRPKAAKNKSQEQTEDL